MRPIQRFLALCAWLGACFAPPAAYGVYVSGDGMGQALIYPYFTVHSVEGNPFHTYLSIVNGDSAAKALRIRFREGRNGRELAGFNLFLAAGQAWAGAVVPSDAGARFMSPDGACASPAFATGGAAAPHVEFSNAAFSGTNADGFGADIDRLREGYVEVLEMASLAALAPCDELRAERIGPLRAPSGRLSGTLTIINVQSGLDFTLNAEALDQLAIAAYYRPPSDPYPDYDAEEIGKVASFLLEEKHYSVVMPTGLGAVEAALAARGLHNDVTLDASTRSMTDWVVTMPTRRLHRPPEVSSRWFHSVERAPGSATGIRAWGYYSPREGEVLYLKPACVIACQAAQPPIDIQLPWAANVLALRAAGAPRAGSLTPDSGPGTTDALGSLNGWRVNMARDPGAGSLELEFLEGSATPVTSVEAFATRLRDASVVHERIPLQGLPVVGFMVRTLSNGTLDCAGRACQGSYGGATAHRVRRKTSMNVFP